ncbi:MAG: hypothetical protein ACYDCL_22605 [Myxococcales bacterium]
MSVGGAAEPAPRPSSLTEALEAATVLAAVVFALGYWLLLPGRLPSERDYLAVQHELLANARPGDGVAVLPFWADRGKLFARGLPVVALPQLASEADAERYGRLWVLAQPELPRSDAPAELAALDRRLARAAEPRRFGPLSLSLYEPKPGRAPSYDFVGRLTDARVSIGGDDPAECQAVPGGFQCPRGPWNYVRPEWHEFDFLPRRCLWAHPVGPEPLRLQWSQVPLREGLRGGFGLIGQAAEIPNAAPVSLAVVVDGAAQAELQLSPGDPGWHEFDLGLAGLSEGAHEVELDVSTPNPGMRHFCFDAVGY